MTAQEYEVEIEVVKRELLYWQNYTTDLEQILIELTMCVKTVNQFAQYGMQAVAPIAARWCNPYSSRLSMILMIRR
jgi:thermostable 8-oxoguanine DNA glycosylase